MKHRDARSPSGRPTATRSTLGAGWRTLALLAAGLLAASPAVAQQGPGPRTAEAPGGGGEGPFHGLTTRNIGPAGMSGRTTAIAVRPGAPSVIYAGGGTGGVWKSSDGGVTWSPIFDD
ncbi:MAG: hypothetical protein D6701_11975, partial [Gemmatimonadetes bacterium]